jgi:hypothetical protein
VGWWDRIADVTVTPARPRPSQPVTVTVNGRKSAENVAIERKDLRIEGERFILDVYWGDDPPFVILPGDYPWRWDPFELEQRYSYRYTLGTHNIGTHAVVVKHWRHGRICAGTYLLFSVGRSTRPGRLFDAVLPDDAPWWSAPSDELSF